MPKQVVIVDCTQCPFFDYHYYDYIQVCVKLDRVIPEHRIPSDCPLKDATEEAQCQ